MSDRPEWRDFGGNELESVRSVERGTYNRSFRDRRKRGIASRPVLSAPQRLEFP